MTTNGRTRPRRVDFLTDVDDFRVALLGALGKSTRFITTHTDLTPYQVNYRLTKAGIKRRDYRDGTSPYDRLIFAEVEDALTLRLRRVLHAQFPPRR